MPDLQRKLMYCFVGPGRIGNQVKCLVSYVCMYTMGIMLWVTG